MLKKLFALSVFALMMLVANAQTNIQRSFGSLSFGTDYYSAYNAISRMSFDKVNQAVERPDLLRLYDVRFGGYQWRYAVLSFDASKSGQNSSAVFYAIDFTQDFSDFSIAESRYKSLFDSLCQKYGEAKVIKEGTDTQAVWCDNTSICYLEFKYSQALNEEYYWYVILSYWDMAIVDKRSSEQFDEL